MSGARGKNYHNQKARLEAAQRQSKALELRASGMTVRAIGDALGVSVASAHKYLQNALADLAEEQRATAAAVRALEDERLDRLLQAWFPLAVGDGKRPPDPVAADRVLKILARRAAMHGIDAPTRVDLSAEVTMTFTDLVQAVGDADDE